MSEIGGQLGVFFIGAFIAASYFLLVLKAIFWLEARTTRRKSSGLQPDAAGKGGEGTPPPALPADAVSPVRSREDCA